MLLLSRGWGLLVLLTVLLLCRLRARPLPLQSRCAGSGWLCCELRLSLLRWPAVPPVWCSLLPLVLQAGVLLVCYCAGWLGIPCVAW